MIEPKILYSRTAKDVVNVWRAWAEGPEVVCEWGAQGGKMQISRFKCEPKNEGKRNATTAEEQAVKEVVALYKKKVKEKYSPDLHSAGETNRIKPLLAQDFAKQAKKLTYPVDCSAKLDGVRMLAYWEGDQVSLQSRRGDFYNVEHISKELETWLPKGTILDGELYIHGVSLQNINSLVRRPQPESRKLQYWIFDTVVENKPWTERVALLQDICHEGSEHIVFHQNRRCHNEAEVVQAQVEFVQDGFEGAIVRNHKGLYREGYRSPDLLKVKSWITDEFVILGYKVGKGKFQNCPVFICRAANGKEFDCAPKGTAAERLEMLKEAPKLVGELLVVKHFDLTDEGKPHYPVGMAIRYPEDLSEPLPSEEDELE